MLTVLGVLDNQPDPRSSRAPLELTTPWQVLRYKVSLTTQVYVFGSSK